MDKPTISLIGELFMRAAWSDVFEESKRMASLWITDAQVMKVAALARMSVQMPCSGLTIRVYMRDTIMFVRYDDRPPTDAIPYDDRDLVDLICAAVMPLFGLEYFHDYKSTLQLYG